jgi:seryl-tRNA synthetase
MKRLLVPTLAQSAFDEINRVLAMGFACPVDDPVMTDNRTGRIGATSHLCDLLLTPASEATLLTSTLWFGVLPRNITAVTDCFRREAASGTSSTSKGAYSLVVVRSVPCLDSSGGF